VGRKVSDRLILKPCLINAAKGMWGVSIVKRNYIWIKKEENAKQQQLYAAIFPKFLRHRQPAKSL
jgi:hypothetical protein